MPIPDRHVDRLDPLIDNIRDALARAKSERSDPGAHLALKDLAKAHRAYDEAMKELLAEYDV